MKSDEPTSTVTPAMFHILLALADSQRHGLGIVHEVERRTDGSVRLGPGLLYGSIKKLVAAGYIEEPTKRPPPSRDDPRRRYYRITRRGRRILEAEAARLEQVVGVAREKRVLKGSAAV
jgi:DNA-binding PadR family transcriptional regulator